MKRLANRVQVEKSRLCMETVGRILYLLVLAKHRKIVLLAA